MESSTDPTLVTRAGAERGGDAAPPASIGRYRIERRIGAGGMGVVWLAHDGALDRRVALKQLRGVQGPAELARIQHEARAAAAVVHPNVVTVFDVGASDGQVFVAMEYVEGESLASWLKTPRSWREVLDVLVQAGRALVAAHAAGIVHRDFKPDNVLVGRDGVVKVVDFGIASAREATPIASESFATSPGMTRGVGSPAYMAPERHRGELGDAASDQFAFGATAFEALWGRRPFAGDTVPEIVAAICEGRVQPVPRGGVPVAVQRAIVRALANDRRDRHPDMAALVDALERGGRRRMHVGIGLGAAALAAAVAVGLPRHDECDGGAPHLQAIDDVRAQLAARWGDDGTTVQALDGWRASWADTYRTACEEGRHPRADAALLDRRMACLQRDLGTARATLDILGEHAESDGAASGLVRELDPASCLDPSAEAVDPELAQLEAELARARALWMLGLVNVAAPLAEELVQRAEAHPRSTTWIGAATLHALLLVQHRRLAEAGALLDRAYAVAVEIGDDHGSMSAIQAQATLAHVREDGPALLLCARRAEVQAARLQEERGVWPLSITLMLAAGHRLTGDLQTALVYGREAARRIDERPVAGYGSVGIHVDVGITLLALGRFDEAEAEFARAQAYAAVLPGRTGDPGALEAMLARLQLARRRPDRALEQLLVTAARLQMHGEWDTDNATTVVCLIADTMRDLDEPTLGLRYAERCFEATERENVRGPSHARSLLRVAGSLEESGRIDEAVAYAQRGLGLVQEVLGPDHPEVALALGIAARLARISGDHERARKLEHDALELHERTNAGATSHLGLLLRTGRDAIAAGDLALARRRLTRGHELAVARQGADGPDAILFAAHLLGLRARETPRAGLRAEALALRERLAPLVGAQPTAAKAAVAEVLGER